VLDRARGHGLARLRLTVAPDGLGAAVHEVTLAPVDPALVLPDPERAIELAPVVVAGGIGAHKWADRRLLAAADADAAPRVPLLLDRDGAVLEASRGNLFAVYDGVLVTPPVDGRILPGVTRGRVLRLAAELRIPRREEPLAFDRLSAADELFLTGAVRGIEPVRACDGAFTGSDHQTTAKLAHALRRSWECEK
jgi:para-aminobenzoate synthetase/4-amino-4-deoxychorismate lyase